jgi:hypothetical protein
MRTLSVRGVARRYRRRQNNVSVREHLIGGGGAGRIPLALILSGIARENRSYRVSHQQACNGSWTCRVEPIWSLIIVRIRLNPDRGISDQRVAALRSRWETAIQRVWSSRWACEGRFESVCPLVIDVRWVTGTSIGRFVFGMEDSAPVCGHGILTIRVPWLRTNSGTC